MRPKLPKQEFKRRERDFSTLLNGMATTIVNIIEYLEEDRKETDRLLKNKKDSELTVAEVREQRQKRKESMEDLEQQVDNLRDRLNTFINKQEG